jgi:phage-related protein
VAKGPGGFSVGRVSVKVVPDTSDFRKTLIRELKAAVKGVEVEIPVKINAKTALAQLKVLDQILKKVDRTVTPKVDLKTSVKGGGLDELNKNLDKLKSGADGASQGLGHMSRALLITVAVFLLAAPLIALVATLLAGLPSLLLAILAPIAAVSLGMEGFSKAAEKFQPTVDRLKKSLSANFQDGLTPVFERLNKLAPTLDKGLNRVADGVIHILDQLSMLLTSTEGMAQIENVLSNIGVFLKDLSVFINQSAAAFLKLASVASDSFGILSATLNRFSTSFLEMTNRIADSGQLRAALEGLNKVLDSLLQGFVKLFEAGIKSMAVLGGPMADFINSFIDLIVILMPILTKLSEVVFNVLGQAFESLGQIFAELRPGLEKFLDLVGTLLVGALKALTPILTAVADILSAVFLKALTAIEPYIPVFLDFFTKLGQLIGEVLLAAFQSLEPLLDMFLSFFVSLLEAITPLLPSLFELVTVILRGFADIMAELAPRLAEAAKELLPQLLQIVKDLVPIISDFIKVLIEVLPPLVDLAIQILDVVIPAMTSLGAIVEEVWPSIKQIIEGALLYIQGLVDLVMGVITGDWDRAMEGLKKIADGTMEALKGLVKLGLTAIIDFFIGLPSRIIGTLTGLPADMTRSGRAMMQGLIDGIKAMGQTAINAALGVVNSIRNLLPFSPAKTGPFSGKGYTLYSGMALMEDWAKGIKKGGAAALSAVDGVVGATAGAMEMEANIAADGYGTIGDKIAAVLAQWGIQIDANGLARMVNNVNQKNARR